MPVSMLWSASSMAWTKKSMVDCFYLYGIWGIVGGIGFQNENGGR